MKVFDSHFHIIDPNFPLTANNGYLPPMFDVEEYKRRMSSYQLVGGAVVSGSFQAFDQGYLINALTKLGPQYFGVANIPATITESELQKLNDANVRAVRFNVKRGGSEKLEHIEKLSNSLFEKFDWHTELYIDSKDLKDLRSILETIPKFSIDHLGLSSDGLKDLYHWVEKGVKVKATGFGRLDFEPLPVLRQIYDINPDALMFGSDLPSTRANVPFSHADVQLIENNFSEKEQEKIFYLNAMEWYGKK